MYKQFTNLQAFILVFNTHQNKIMRPGKSKRRLILKKAKHCFAFFDSKKAKHCFANLSTSPSIMRLVIGSLFLIHGLICPTENVPVLFILSGTKSRSPLSDSKRLLVKFSCQVQRPNRLFQIRKTPFRIRLLRSVKHGNKLIPAYPIEVFFPNTVFRTSAASVIAMSPDSCPYLSLISFRPFRSKT